MSAMVQAALPMDLFDRLQRLRSRYSAALKAAGAGDYSRAEELRKLGKFLGHILAGEARKTPAERGGIRMWDISMMVDQAFPELRGWNRYEVEQRQRQRIQGELAARAAASANSQEERAS